MRGSLLSPSRHVWPQSPSALARSYSLPKKGQPNTPIVSQIDCANWKVKRFEAVTARGARGGRQALSGDAAGREQARFGRTFAL